MKALGVMQGRLVPKYQGRYQAFPVGHWQEEFSIAGAIGLECIEFILDSTKNPLLEAKGVDEIKAIVKQTGVGVYTICADYFMDFPLFELNAAKRKSNLGILKTLIQSARTLGVEDIVIPSVDQSSLRQDPSRIVSLIKSLEQVLPLAESLGIRLSLETDLAPHSFLELIKTLGSSHISINYDTGNSASLGYDVREEMDTYGDYITTLHIKDRKKGHGPVVLGQGDANIDLALDLLCQHHFKGCVVLQAYRDDEGISVFKQQLHWFKPILEKYYPLTTLRE
jgi:sugar phosphate isomerase/epimerase